LLIEYTLVSNFIDLGENKIAISRDELEVHAIYLPYLDYCSKAIHNKSFINCSTYINDLVININLLILGIYKWGINKDYQTVLDQLPEIIEYHDIFMTSMAILD
jgi:histidinol phosphatase-like PHP family hydrolase